MLNFEQRYHVKEQEIEEPVAEDDGEEKEGR